MAKLAKERLLANKLISLDPWLKPYRGDIELRQSKYLECRQRLIGDGKLTEFADVYKYYGIHQQEGMWVVREWLPDAKAVDRKSVV